MPPLSCTKILDHYNTVKEETLAWETQVKKKKIETVDPDIEKAVVEFIKDDLDKLF